MKKGICILLAAMLIGCASTRMTSFVDPAFSNTTYSSFLVTSNILDLEGKGILEASVCEEFVALGATCQRAIDVFPPTREFTDEQYYEQFVRSGAQALVVVELSDSYSTQTYVPPRTTTTGNISTFGNTAYYNQTSNTSGGYNIDKPVEEYKISVLDGDSGATALVATSRTRGNAFARSSDMSKSLATELAGELSSKGFILEVQAAE